MPLLLICIILFVAINHFRTSVVILLNPFSTFLHTECLQIIPKKAQAAQELSALACGQNFLTADSSDTDSMTG